MKEKIKNINNKVRNISSNRIKFLSSYYKGLIHKKHFETVESYCIFIGYQRSGSSLVGSLLDAHPNAVIAHELNAIKYFKANYSNNQIYYLLKQNSEQYALQGRNWSGYSYQVPNQWQGRHKTIKVIGDKKAALFTIELTNNPQLLQQIQHTVEVPIKMIHVVRNPYDNITTMFKKKDRRTSKILTFKETIDYYFSLCENISTIKTVVNPENILDIRQEMLIKNPQKTLSKVGDFFGLETSKEYLQDCASIIFQSPRKTRMTIDWKSEDIDIVAEKMANYSFLKDYSFEE